MYKNLMNQIISKEDQENLKPWLGNWTLLSLKMSERTFTEQDIFKLMVIELQNKNRSYILERLYSRFNSLRRDRELKEVDDARKGYRKISMQES